MFCFSPADPPPPPPRDVEIGDDAEIDRDKDVVGVADAPGGGGSRRPKPRKNNKQSISFNNKWTGRRRCHLSLKEERVKWNLMNMESRHAFSLKWLSSRGCCQAIPIRCIFIYPPKIAQVSDFNRSPQINYGNNSVTLPLLTTVDTGIGRGWTGIGISMRRRAVIHEVPRMVIVRVVVGMRDVDMVI